MKLLSIITKNLKLLLRSKGAALVAVVGPLLIIALVGLALNNTQRLDVAVGVVVPETTNLTLQYLQGLRADQYLLTNFSRAEDCARQIRQGSIHTCVVFPSNFTVVNGRTNELIIYVDNSRQNLVYAVINSLSANFRGTALDLSADLTTIILDSLFRSRGVLQDEVGALSAAQVRTENSTAVAARLRAGLAGIDLNYSVENLQGLGDRINTLDQQAIRLRDKGLDVVRSAKAFTTLVEANSSIDTGDFRADIDRLEEALEASYNTTSLQIGQLAALVLIVQSDLDALNQKVTMAKVQHAVLEAGLQELGSSLGSLGTELAEAKRALESQRTDIEGIEVTDVANIVAPVRTRIEPVAGGHTRLSFLFPYLLMLLILFIGIMLPATIIVLEKTSSAFFRAFTTPTRSPYYIMATFLTALLLLSVQVAVFLGLASYFLSAEILANLAFTVFVLLVAMGVFILLGMAIGYAFESQEAVTLVSISVGSVLLLLSDLVLPLETFGASLRRVAAYNPYLIASDLLRQSLLFSARLSDLAVLRAFGWLLAYGLGLALLVIGVHKTNTHRFFRQHPAERGLQRPLAPEEQVLVLDDNTVIRDKDDLLEALKTMSDATFAAHCYENRNEFTLWVRDALGDRILAARLANRPREQMIAVLEGHLAEERREFARRIRKNPEGGAGNYY